MHRSKKNKEDHSSEWMDQYAQKGFDRADIVRDVRLCDFYDRSLSRGKKLS